jgi:hypothetical protein
MLVVQVKNVILYLTEMQRSLSDKLTKDFFNNPSQVHSAWRILLQHADEMSIGLSKAMNAMPFL